MEYRIRYRSAAVKYLDRQTDATRRRILNAIDELPNGNVLKLTNRPGYRLSVGNYHVLFDYEGSDTIFVTAIGLRGDVYK